MTSRSLGHRAPLLWLVFPLIAGLALAKANVAIAPAWLLTGAGASATWGIFAAWRAPRGWAPAIAITLLLAGNASYTLHRARIADWENLPRREAQLMLRIDRVFTQSEANKVSGLATIVRAEAPVQELAGQPIYFSLALRTGEAAPLRSAIVSTAGVLATLPRNPPADTFDGYLAAAGMNFRLTRGRVLRAEKPANSYQQFCARAARRLSEILGRGVVQKRPDLVAVLRAMMLGQQSELSPEQDRLFMQSGTMHMFSISGLHIAVIAGGLQALLALARLPKPAQFLIGLAVLWLYVDITGCAPSAVRAFLMVAALQASLLFRMPGNPLSTLTLSALIVLLLDPMQLFSASFQMSYGIVAALLLLGLPLADAWQERMKLFAYLPEAMWRWHHWGRAWLWRATVTAVSIGLASTLVGAVSGILFFKLFTPGALFANLMLIPAASLVIMGGFLSLIFGLTGADSLSSLFNHAAIVVLAAIDALVRGFVRVPAMWFDARFSSPSFGAVALVVLMIALFYGYAQSWRKSRGGWWPPFAIVAVTLILSVKFG